jgi:hypothetical protein
MVILVYKKGCDFMKRTWEKTKNLVDETAGDKMGLEDDR